MAIVDMTEQDDVLINCAVTAFAKVGVVISSHSVDIVMAKDGRPAFCYSEGTRASKKLLYLPKQSCTPLLAWSCKVYAEVLLGGAEARICYSVRNPHPKGFVACEGWCMVFDGPVHSCVAFTTDDEEFVLSITDHAFPAAISIFEPPGDEISDLTWRAYRALEVTDVLNGAPIQKHCQVLAELQRVLSADDSTTHTEGEPRRKRARIE